MMTIIRMLYLPVAVVFAIATCVAGAPMQIHGENIGLNNEIYSQPELAEALVRTYEAMGVPATRIGGPVGGPHRLRQQHRSEESPFGLAFDESKRFEYAIQNNPNEQNLNRERMMNGMQFKGSAKRNFDEIDRTNFDSFVKRNFDEIDRSDLDSFVKRKRLAAYLASRQR